MSSVIIIEMCYLKGSVDGNRYCNGKVEHNRNKDGI